MCCLPCRRKAREQKAYAKQVQAEKVKERAQEKKRQITQVQQLRKQREKSVSHAAGHHGAGSGLCVGRGRDATCKVADSASRTGGGGPLLAPPVVAATCCDWLGAQCSTQSLVVCASVNARPLSSMPWA